MKDKFFVLSVLLLGMLPKFAVADCGYTKCNNLLVIGETIPYKTGHNDPNVYKKINYDCWICGGNAGCAAGEVVPRVDDNGTIKELYQCQSNKGFKAYNVFNNGIQLCNDSDIKINLSGLNFGSFYYPNNAGRENMVLEIRSKNSNRPVITDIANVSNFDASDYCLYISCWTADGEGHKYVPNAERNKCVNAKSEAEQKCDIMIGLGKAERWGGDTCICKDTANAEWKNNDCVCKDTNANMDSKGKCVCKDEGMEFDKDGKCVKKVEESNDGTGDQNEENSGKTACEGLISSGKATKWDDANNTCLCKDTANAEWKDNDCVCKDTANAEWKNNACVCKDDGMEFDKDGKCVQKSNKIEELGSWLDAEAGKFERSKWRDAEGKFNTARLASDSIAAVVLGTAGGLVSSKVIKKKQVENGFEDIKCTIGSQEVADWGDEFQVGIQ